MAAVVAAQSTGMAGKKQLRKPYAIKNPRQKWAADEHGRFLHALALHGRDWKSIEAFVARHPRPEALPQGSEDGPRARCRRRCTTHVAPAAQPPIGWMPPSLSFTDGDGAAAMAEDETIGELPMSPDHTDFGSDAPRPVEAKLQRLLGADPFVVETILYVLGNLEANLPF